MKHWVFSDLHTVQFVEEEASLSSYNVFTSCVSKTLLHSIVWLMAGHSLVGFTPRHKVDLIPCV